MSTFDARVKHTRNCPLPRSLKLECDPHLGKIILLGIISIVCIARTSGKTASGARAAMMRRGVSS